jgi:hypothetical protein
VPSLEIYLWDWLAGRNVNDLIVQKELNAPLGFANVRPHVFSGNVYYAMSDLSF